MKINEHLATKTENEKLPSFPVYITQTLSFIHACTHPHISP
jgi:hypothetical protein